MPLGAEMSPGPPPPNPYRLLAIYTSLIFLMPASLLGGYFLGSQLDQYLGTSPWFLIIGVLLGGAGAFIQLFRILKKEYKR